jgi:3-deoxy-7-phosphoheptulonate synthase
MIIQLDQVITDEARRAVFDQLRAIGLRPTEVRTQFREYLVCMGDSAIDIRIIGAISGVSDVHRVLDPYQLVSRSWRVHPTTIDLGDGVTISEGGGTIMMGPCSVESPEQLESVARFLVSEGVQIIRGGVFKPRSSPYSFRGLGAEGLRLFSNIVKPLGLKVISEVLEPSQIEEMFDVVDIFQVGARNSQNFSLLDALGKVDKPVLLKRGLSGTIEELLQSAEYIYANGNERIILCERGIRTYEKAYRNTLDLNAIPILKEKTHLPVIVDPSHGIGIRRHVHPMSLAALMAGADGLIIETHPIPEEAKSDGDQSLNFAEAKRLISAAREVSKLRREMECRG